MRVTEVFGMLVSHFLSEPVVNGTETYNLLLKAGTVSLTVERSGRSRRGPPVYMPNLSSLLDAPKSYPDVVLVASDGEEFKAHKFVLAGMRRLF